MLVLSRRTNERIAIGEDVIVTIVEVSRGRVKVGIDAPRDVRVQRGELHDGRDAATDAKTTDADSTAEEPVASPAETPHGEREPNPIVAVARVGDEELERMSRAELLELIHRTCEPEANMDALRDKDRASLLQLAHLVRWGCRAQLDREGGHPRDTNIFGDTHLES